MDNVILTERSNPDTVNIDLMTPYEIAKAINNEDKKVALAVETQLEPIGKAINAAAESFLSGGRLAYFGAGTSGRLGVLDASECPPTFGAPHGMVTGFIAGGEKALLTAVENAEDNEELARQDMATFNPQKNDVVVGISASGNPCYVLKVLQIARRKGCTTVAITSNPQAKIKEFADIFICPQVGQEAITGSSRMKSGTAQKLVLNMISSGAMIRIGKTYKNYMIDVQIMNEKLHNRGCRIVAEICNISMTEAEQLLREAQNSVKAACVMKHKNCTLSEAQELLRQAGGVLRKVI